jgi:hypothetical protein
MGDLSGTIVISSVVPTNSADTYPTHDSQYGKGGAMEAANTTARDAIPAARRTEGMRCWCVDPGKEYRLVGGIANGNWAEVSVTTSVHAIDSATHTSTATPGKMLKAAATTGLPTEGTNTDTDVASAVSLKHTASGQFNAATSGEINALTEKTVPVDDDIVLIEDSAASYAKKKVKMSNIGGGSAASFGDWFGILAFMGLA